MFSYFLAPRVLFGCQQRIDWQYTSGMHRNLCHDKGPPFVHRIRIMSR